ncbi:MAG TPA: hypothetical protein VI643_03375 [Planctomycetota bacterium]|nr:hypothetical protein [Planctomycetota bacterium]
MSNFLDKLFRRSKKKLTLEEVRIEEKRLELREAQAVKKLELHERNKQDLFRKGADCKSRALRQIYARKFEEITKRGQFEERELARLGKEIRVVGRIRMVLDRQARQPSAMPLIERLDEGQLHELMKLIDTADLKDAEFMEKVDVLLGITDREPEAVTDAIGTEGMEVLKVWEEMDKGEFEFEEGLKQASQAVEKTEKERKEAEPTG